MGTKRTTSKAKKAAKPTQTKRTAGRTKSPVAHKKKVPARAVAANKPSSVEKSPRSEARKITAMTEPVESPRLLRDTKATTAALSLLERGIKQIFQKEFKKARAELKNLIETYPGEAEISARARSYLQICDREETAHKKPAIAHDQLYNLGVMEHNRGDFAKAVTFFKQSLEKNPKSDHIYYSLAASFAMKGEIAEAIRNLQKAIELNEENRVFAKNDSDFTQLHGEKEFGELVGWSQPSAGGKP